ncbi:redoxin [Dyella jiangningensis]|uniref:Redoxin n=2 Tax=Dyella jiangningensis TaxID=1379159 RepID=A0A328PAV6_9GAMM|nr:TlpA disulfide reductase family protein [Dyella jiangningensis]RAO78293.1 redoxin [Dyella jiangningensis]
MLSRSNGIILGLAVAVAAAGGWLQHASRQAHAPAGEPAVDVGSTAPDLSLPALDGKQHRLSDYRGRRVLLNFWATWCAPCLKEMPALARTQANVGEKGAIVIGIAMDDPARVKAFLASHPVNYPILIGSLESPSTSLQLGNVGELLPYSVLLDENGRVLATRRGVLDDDQLQRWLAPTAP